MDGLEQRLDSLLSDPESMAKIMDLAKSLNLSPTSQNDTSEDTTVSKETHTEAVAQFPLANLGSLLSEFSGQGLRDDKQTALLKALRPYLRPERQDRLDRAIQTARMVKTAKLAMRQFMPRGDQYV